MNPNEIAKATLFRRLKNRQLRVAKLDRRKKNKKARTARRQNR